ncbi:MAG: SEC-C metal-binding domain-containing protein [Nitrospirota bacterium]|nr:SEC-C metal-binding domain-containing protein [Nitrospirota bacterium]
MKLFRGIANIFRSEEGQIQKRETGRNELCWCGSGKKYKKCHLMEDDRKAKRNYGLNCGKT